MRSELVLLEAIGAGDPRCVEGGYAAHEGVDANQDGRLGAEEITSTLTVCAAAPEVPPSVLVVVDTERTPPQCLFGGGVLRVGLDEDGDGGLSEAETRASHDLCYGPQPGGLPHTLYGNIGVESDLSLSWLQGVENIVGTLSVTGPHVDLDVLSELALVTGDVRITDAPGVDLHALRSLAEVGGDLELLRFPDLETLAGLEALRGVGGVLRLTEAPHLSNVAALEGLERATSLEFQALPALCPDDLEGLAARFALSVFGVGDEVSCAP